MRRGRRGGRRPPTPREGDLVIDGRVRARLLGLQLLELDAQVVVAEARWSRVGGAAHVTDLPASSPGRRSERSTASTPVGDGNKRAALPRPSRRDLPLARAEQLLAEGTELLAGARQIR